ncbi:MAG: B12-binding domain-containing radical SAM protein [Lachnospiraceae bacterium]|nr:B12-binding domain-containing radical SAM protein [Lachnospiraceae bacterium]
MSSTEENDIIFIQPHLLSDLLKHEQNQIVVEFWDTMHKHAVLLGDIPSEPNHGIFFIAGTLLKAGYKVDALDFHAYDRYLRYSEGRKVEYSDIEESIRTKKAKVFAISSKTVAINRAIEIGRIIRRNHPSAVIIFGGLHPTLHGQELIKENPEIIDYIIQGEGEEATLELLQHLEGDRDINEVKNLLYMGENGEVIINEKRLICDIDIDNLPYPAYELICRESSPIVPRILSARGCPHSCAFCSITYYYDRKYKLRSPESVVAEIEYMIEKFDIDFYCLGDLTFLLNREYTHKICNLIIERGLSNVKWWCQTTIGRVNKEDLELMKKAGCIQVAFGVEADDQAIINAVDKPYSVTKTEEQCRLVKEMGMTVQNYWLIGLGGDTKESIERRIEQIKYYIENNLTDSIHISVPVPFPGTPIWSDPGRFGYKINHTDFSQYWMNCDELGYGKPVVDLENLTADHLYMYWFLALSAATESFKKVVANKDNTFSHFRPKGLFDSDSFEEIPAFF